MIFRLYDRQTNKIITERVARSLGIFLSPLGNLMQIVVEDGVLYLKDVTERYGLLRKVACG